MNFTRCVRTWVARTSRWANSSAPGQIWSRSSGVARSPCSATRWRPWTARLHLRSLRRSFATHEVSTCSATGRVTLSAPPAWHRCIQRSSCRLAHVLCRDGNFGEAEHVPCRWPSRCAGPRRSSTLRAIWRRAATSRPSCSALSSHLILSPASRSFVIASTLSSI